MSKKKIRDAVEVTVIIAASVACLTFALPAFAWASEFGPVAAFFAGVIAFCACIAGLFVLIVFSVVGTLISVEWLYKQWSKLWGYRPKPKMSGYEESMNGLEESKPQCKSYVGIMIEENLINSDAEWRCKYEPKVFALMKKRKHFILYELGQHHVVIFTKLFRWKLMKPSIKIPRRDMKILIKLVKKKFKETQRSKREKKTSI